MKILSWLLQGGPRAAKHRGKVHPVVTFLLHYAVVASVTVSAHDFLIMQWPIPDESGSCISSSRQSTVGVFFAVYFVAYFSCRLALRWHQPDFYIQFYEQTFLCSVTIFHASLGLSTNRPILAASFCVAVGIDQILWYVDLAGYLLL